MSLLPLPDTKETLIVVGTTVRRNLDVLHAHLASVARQELPPRVKLHFCYVPDFTSQQQDAQQYLLRWVNERGGELVRSAHPPNESDFYDGPNADSHQWGGTAMARVGANKNLILHRALHLRADAVWLVDSDLVLDPTTLASLLACEKPVVSAVFWTKWSKRGTETSQVHAAPQVWLNHPYALEGRGLDAAGFRKKLVEKELTQVWGFGACTLVSTDVIRAGVTFDYLPDVPLDGLMAGEDRHFALRCERLHIPCYADPWPDIAHVYHAEDQSRLPAWTARLCEAHPATPTLSDLVALRLRALEPVSVSPGRVQQFGPEHVRGVLAGLDLQPELREAVLTMTRGESRIVKVHFPSHHPHPFLRGRIRLIDVLLVDCKPNVPPPVLDEELYRGVKSGAVLDYTTLSHHQHLDIRADGGADA